MGNISHESFDVFLDSIKNAGVLIKNERELRERLSETQTWRFAFATLAAHGKSLGISFEDKSQGKNKDALKSAFSRFQFPAPLEALFSSSLQAA